MAFGTNLKAGRGACNEMLDVGMHHLVVVIIGNAAE
jgi:hypothetical protein